MGGEFECGGGEERAVQCVGEVKEFLVIATELITCGEDPVRGKIGQVR